MIGPIISTQGKRRTLTFYGVPLNSPNWPVYVPCGDAKRVAIAGVKESGTWAATIFDIKATTSSGLRELEDGPTLDFTQKFIALDREATSGTRRPILTGITELAIVAPSTASEAGTITLTITLDLE